MLVRPRTDDDLPALAEVLRCVHAESGYPVQGIDDPIKFLSEESLVKAWVLITPDDQPVGQCVVSEIHQRDERLLKWEQYLWKSSDPGGSAGEVTKSKYLALGRLFVDPLVHGKGGGEKLVQQAVDWAGGVLMRRLVLNVLLKDSAAIALYRKLGWTEYGEGTLTNAQGEKYKQVYFIGPHPRRISSAASQTVAMATNGSDHWDEIEKVRSAIKKNPSGKV
ncbi:hypothetical protein KVT40_006490 [Elsinoe batatas]|uniref:N-acetyltransferase domain-containing protein n=1 Tax=Elsinoe batatas TaxID=2601811 RepID=A0A8K0KY15_9PEZI|nr:hypothetical protein KVT40_006490 [Elsinoe batatas]